MENLEKLLEMLIDIEESEEVEVDCQFPMGADF